MPEITFIVDEMRGEIVVEDNPDLNAATVKNLQGLFGEAAQIACARPREIIVPPNNSAENLSNDIEVRIAGYYHNSLTEGPGRRSSVLFQFCPLKCEGCYVPELHDKKSGTLISVKELAEILLDAKFERDGVTILGGEPFAQPEGLFALIEELRSKDCRHIVCYSGYTIEELNEKSVRRPAISAILERIDILIDGPYIQSLSKSAGLWTGSGNQRVIDLVATRKRGQLVLHQC